MNGPAAAGERVGLLLASASEVPGGDEWLAPEEIETLAGLRIAKRRAEWRLGRWTAKWAVAVFLGVDSGSVGIAAAPDGAPEATVGGAPAPCALSLSHRAGLAACAVADLHVAVGCDLEAVEPRTPEFVTDYLTSGEAAAVRAAPTDERDLLANLVWSAKESVLKATRTGLRADTRSVEILLRSGGNGSEWTSFAARLATDPTAWAGWWRRIGEHVVTVAARPDPAEPAELRS